MKRYENERRVSGKLFAPLRLSMMTKTASGDPDRTVAAKHQLSFLRLAGIRRILLQVRFSL